MTDLVKRLRGRIGPLMYQHDNGIDITLEAADHIEALEAVADAARATGLGSSEWANRLDVALAALEDKP